MENNTKNSEIVKAGKERKLSYQLEPVSGNQTFGFRLRLRREELGLSQAEFGKRIGVTTTTIQNYEYGGSPKGDVLIKIAKELDCSLDWLLMGKTEQKTHSLAEANALKKDTVCTCRSTPGPIEGELKVPVLPEPEPDNYNWVPMVEAELSAGGGSFIASETIKDYYAFRKPFISHIATSAKNLVLMRVSGNSMDPEIRNGATVMIDMGRRRIRNNCIFALGFEDTIIIKELERLPAGRVRIISKNRAEYPPYEADAKDLRIIGQVVWGDRLYPI